MLHQTQSVAVLLAIGLTSAVDASPPTKPPITSRTPLLKSYHSAELGLACSTKSLIAAKQPRSPDVETDKRAG